jgi:hypothetical protein
MRLARLLIAHLGVMTVLSIVYLVWLPGSAVLVCALSIVAAGAVATGIGVHRPSRWRSWAMVGERWCSTRQPASCTTLCWVPVGTLKPGVRIVWLLHLAMLVVLMAGTLGLVRSRPQRYIDSHRHLDYRVERRPAGRDPGRVSYAGTPGIDLLWASVRVGYVARDVLVLAPAAYVGLAVRRSPSSLLFQAGLLGLVVYDVVFRLGRIRDEWLAGGPIEIG